jgi:hypothetical protein
MCIDSRQSAICSGGIYAGAESRFGEAPKWLDGRSDRSDRRCGGSWHHRLDHSWSDHSGDDPIVDHLHTGDAATIYKDYPNRDDYDDHAVRFAATIGYNDSAMTDKAHRQQRVQ